VTLLPPDLIASIASSINAGNYLLLTPLPVGKHTIQLRWGWKTDGNVLDVDVVYHTTVVPHRAD